jgi:hypothetical protein
MNWETTYVRHTCRFIQAASLLLVSGFLAACISCLLGKLNTDVKT